MLSPENHPPQPENQSPNPKIPPQKPPQEQPLKCPRCDSSNTKFCYYNNYSLTQPRHFCKTCRRYWTRGGALRNVPIGGGCRKTNKRLKTTTSTVDNTTSKLFSGPTGFKFMNPVGHTPAMGFDPAGVYNMPSGPYFGLNLMDLNYSLVHGNPGGNELQSSISSIESLSSINQEMHWKLQQQRLAMFYENKADDDQKTPQVNNMEINISNDRNSNHNNNNNSNNSDALRKIEVGPTEWLFNQIETSVNMGISRSDSTCCNNVHNEVGGSNLSGVWGDLLDHNHHHHHQQLHFNGLD